MSEKTENSNGALDMVKWVVVIGLLVTGVALNTIYQDSSVLYRAIGVVALVIIALWVAAGTVKGSQFITFAKEARIEVRKVVWPSRQEATQTTLIVLVATLIMSLLLWGLDGIIVRVVTFITSLGA